MSPSSGRLAGKVAVITGAASGIGAAAAELFVAEGARVVCADLSPDVRDVARSIGPAAVAIQADVSRSDDVAAAVGASLEHFGRLDVMFNNAGFGGGTRALLADIDEEVFDRQIAVHLKGVFLGMKHAIPHLLDGGGGSIINTASAAGLVGWREISAYSAAKGGVVQLTRSAALDYAEVGIRVNAICPGMTWTGAAGRSTEVTRDTVPPQPMARWGESSELASAALFLASDDSSFVTGVALPVDGGYVAR